MGCNGWGMQTAIQLNFGSVNAIDVDSIHIFETIKFKRALTLRWYMYWGHFLDCCDFHIIMLLSMLGLQFIAVNQYIVAEV